MLEDEYFLGFSKQIIINGSRFFGLHYYFYTLRLNWFMAELDDFYQKLPYTL